MPPSSDAQQYYSTQSGPETESGRKIPRINPYNAEFYRGCNDNLLRLQRCDDCAQFRFYPAPGCPYCQSQASHWEQVSGNGKIYSLSIVHRPAPGFNGRTPYAYALVELDEGPVMPTNIVDADLDKLQIGDPVTVRFSSITESMKLPEFVPVAAQVHE